MEWYEWVFAFCAASMAFATAVLSAEVYARVRDWRAGRDEQDSRRPGR